jgi:hypothetical protein
MLGGISVNVLVHMPTWVSVWEEYRGTETAVRNKAKAIVDLHHVSAALRFEAGFRSGISYSPIPITSANMSGALPTG